MSKRQWMQGPPRPSIGLCAQFLVEEHTRCLQCTFYLLNAIVEQLFLYPAFVGEALGLNVLETMIVVLLGGLFAGLAGMIFAVPVASVLKFIVPRLYQSLRGGDELSLPEETDAVPAPESAQ